MEKINDTYLPTEALITKKIVTTKSLTLAEQGYKYYIETRKQDGVIDK